MEAKNQTVKRQQTNQNQVRLSDVLFLTLGRWPWLLLSVAVCVGVAAAYLLRTPSLYTRSAEILIKSDSNGKSSTSDLSTFSDMGLIQMNNNIDDEVNKLKSPDIMESVVKRLGLDMTYQVDGRFHRDILYGTALPLSVSFPAMPDDVSATAEVEVSADGKVRILDLKSGEKDIALADDGRVTFGDTVRSGLGAIVIDRTPYFEEGTPYNIYVTKSPVGSMVGMFSSELGVTVKNDKGNTIQLTVTDLSVQRAEDLLNMVITVYNENWIKAKNRVSVSTSEFINDRLGVIEKELGNVDQDISSYKSEHRIPDVGQAASMYMTENQQANSQLLDLNNRLQITRYIRGFITDAANRGQVLSANSGIGSGVIENQIAEYNTVMMQRNRYAANSSESNPVVEGLDRQLSGMRTGIIQSIDNQIVALNTAIRNIRDSRDRATARIAETPTQAKDLLSVERQQKVKESLYLFLLQKREENELSQAFTAYNTEIITYPTGSDVPTAPNRRNILMCAFLVGLVLPFGYTYVRESNNTKIRGRNDVKDLSLPFLGEIPQYGSRKKAKGKDRGDADKAIVVKEGRRDVINEAFRVLRTNLEFMNVTSDGANVIAVTSFNPGSGKSFMTMNLGYALAIKNRKVLVIDGDMRHGSSSAYIGSPETGLSDYLGGRTQDIRSVIKTYEGTPTLDILPIGSVPPNPTELLENGRFAELLGILHGDYDYILIDCPPIEVVADAQIIDRYADRTVFVIRAGLLERSMLGEMERIFEERKFRNMAFILNGTSSSKGRYGYSHSYRYGYGYGYGYGYHYGSKSSDKKSRLGEDK